MNNVSRPLLITLVVMIVVLAFSMALAATHEHGGINGPLMFFDHDLSDSAFAWAIAIPILLLVGVIVVAVCAGAALLTVVALVFAALLTVLALILAMTPFAVFLAIPVLAVYGLVKLTQRQPVRTV